MFLTSILRRTWTEKRMKAIFVQLKIELSVSSLCQLRRVHFFSCPYSYSTWKWCKLLILHPVYAYFVSVRPFFRKSPPYFAFTISLFSSLSLVLVHPFWELSWNEGCCGVRANCVSHIQPRGASFACPIFTSKAFSEKSVFILGTPAAKAVHCVREIRLENIYFVVLSCS